MAVPPQALTSVGTGLVGTPSTACSPRATSAELVGLRSPGPGSAAQLPGHS